MPERLTVIQILPALQSGGVERGTLEVARFLAEQGHRSVVISAGGRLVKQLVAEGSEHIVMPVGRKSLTTLRFVPKLKDLFRQYQADIVHVRSRFPAWITYLTLKSMPKKQRPGWVSTVHGPYSVNAYSRIMTRAERVIVISEMIRDYVLQNYPVNTSNIVLNYRGIDPHQLPYGYQANQAWLQSWYQEFPQTRDKMLITLPARITRWKGQQDFIQLMAQLLKQHPQAHGLIVGDCQSSKKSYQQMLMQQIHQAGLSEHITFTGHRPDIREIMTISDIVLSLSIKPEAFGRTTLEALALGKPVIGYAHGGVDEQLRAILPAGRIACGDITAAANLATKWLQQPPIVPRNMPFLLQTMLDNTLSVYCQLHTARNPS